MRIAPTSLSSHGEAIQRLGPVAALADVVRELGGVPAAVFDPIGIDPDTLSEGTVLPFETVLALLDQAARHTGCEHIGLMLGRRYTSARHGVVGAVMRSAPTLKDALLDFITWQQGYSTGAVAYLNRMGADYALGYGSYNRLRPGTRQLYDLSMAFGVTMVQELTGRAVMPLEVLYSLRPPADTRPYRMALRVPVRFDEDQTCVVLAGKDLATALPGANPDQHDRALATLHAAFDRSFAVIESRVRHMIRPLVHAGSLSAETLSRSLNLNPRTLRRKLAEVDTHYDVLRDDVLFAMACELLGMTDLTIGHVSTALGFSTHATFVRAFRRWCGQSPTTWRQAQHWTRPRPPLRQEVFSLA